MNLGSLKKLAERRYERARAMNAAGFAFLIAAPFGCASVACCMFPNVTIALGTALAATLGFSRYRGLWLARGLSAGLLAGSLGFALPIACRWLMLDCVDLMCHVPLLWVAAIGMAAGALAVGRAPVGSRAPALVTAALVGSLGALAGGIAGPLALAGGAAIGGALGLLARRSSR